MPANGCELSGRGSLAHILIPECGSRSSLAYVVESPVRSSELLAGAYLRTPIWEAIKVTVVSESHLAGSVCVHHINLEIPLPCGIKRNLMPVW